jgi:acetylornithine deacetylase/succinyl-diaminopimelate desuccinylase-like protein
VNTAYIDNNFDRFVGELKAWLRIPSISADPAHKEDVRAAAQWAADQLLLLQMQAVEVIETAGHPLVYAEWLRAPGKPTLLFYGHFDVQPADLSDGWKSHPFEPDIRNGQIYARGATDDKGQVFAFLKALELLYQEGEYPLNLKVLLEGEEETDGASIEAYVPQHKAKLQADAVLICDSGMPAPGLPAIETGLRGLIYLEAEVRGATQDLHSGLYGGVAPNPIHALAVIIAKLRDSESNLHIPGLMELLPANPADEEKFWCEDPLELASNMRREMGVNALVGPEAVPPLKRVMAWPTLEVHGIAGGFTGAGSKTVIPAVATAKLSMRLPGGVDPIAATKLLEQALHGALPAGYHLKIEILTAGAGTVIDPAGPAMRAAATALERIFGKAPVYLRSGGSIPVVALLDYELKAPTILTGFSLPDDGLHAPNEKFSLEQLRKGIAVVAEFLRCYGREGEEL